MPEENKNTGSSTQGEPVYLAIGMFRRPHGVKGDLLMEIYTDFPERLRSGTKIYLGNDRVQQVIARIRPHSDGLLVSLRGVDSPETAGVFRNVVAYVPASDRPALPEGQYYHHQLIGLQVISDDGKALGELTEIIPGRGANDVFVVTSPAGREVLLPDIPPVVLQIDLPSKTMRVHLLDGLLDEATGAE